MVTEEFVNCKRTAQERGLVTNENKTKYMEVTTRHTNTQFLALIIITFRRSHNLNI
jgi:hypothetical protein